MQNRTEQSKETRSRGTKGGNTDKEAEARTEVSKHQRKTQIKLAKTDIYATLMKNNEKQLKQMTRKKYYNEWKGETFNRERVKTRGRV